MTSFIRPRLNCRVSSQIRYLATPSTSTPKPKPSFSETLVSGPSLDDFISGEPIEHVVLGNTKGYVQVFLFICEYTYAFSTDLGCQAF